MSNQREPSWTKDGKSILSSEQLDAVRLHLDKVGNIAVLHWHYYGASAPSPLAFDEFDKFEEYLKTRTKPGDAIDVWPFPGDRDKVLAEGKIPNEKGEVPDGGSY